MYHLEKYIHWNFKQQTECIQPMDTGWSELVILRAKNKGVVGRKVRVASPQSGPAVLIVSVRMSIRALILYTSKRTLSRRRCR